ncbi:unnamed protein product [Brassica oleracea var. botrytis]
MNHISIPVYIGLGSYYPRRVMKEVDKQLEEGARGREIPKGKNLLGEEEKEEKEYYYETIEDLIDLMKVVVPFEP